MCQNLSMGFILFCVCFFFLLLHVCWEFGKSFVEVANVNQPGVR